MGLRSFRKVISGAKEIKARAVQCAGSKEVEEKSIVLISYSMCLALHILFLFNTAAHPRKSLGLSCM